MVTRNVALIKYELVLLKISNRKSTKKLFFWKSYVFRKCKIKFACVLVVLWRLNYGVLSMGFFENFAGMKEKLNIGGCVEIFFEKPNLKFSKVRL